MAESAEFELWGGKLKTMCMVTNINTVTTVIEEGHHQSVRALTTEWKINQESSTYTTSLLFRWFCKNDLCQLVQFRYQYFDNVSVVFQILIRILITFTCCLCLVSDFRYSRSDGQSKSEYW